MKRSILFSLLMAGVLYAADTNECAFMNAATATGILGHAVEKKTAAPDSCEFVAASRDVLRIEVKAAGSSRVACGSHAQPLKGIGNEAFACEAKASSGERTERVSGRVRDRAFVITLTASDASVTEDSLLANAKRAAEQVAGNLF